jgi:hypothetical protein
MGRHHLCKICGVAKGNLWPAPDIAIHLQEGTNEQYYTPNFELGVKAKVNIEILKKAVSLTMEEIVSESNLRNIEPLSLLQDWDWHTNTLPEALTHPAVKYNQSNILAFVKQTFQGFKIKVLANYDPACQEQNENNKKSVQRNMWQNHTYEKRLQAADEYAAQHSGLDIRQVFHQEFVSDYASGPEMDSDKTYKKWKVWMGLKLGMEKSKMDPKSWKCTRFQQQINLNWRSKKVSLTLPQQNC